MRLRHGRLRATLFLGAGLATASVGCALWFGDLLRGPEHQTVDLRFTVRGDREPPPGLALVHIDADTFTDLRVVQWPFPRSLHGRVIDRLREAGARAIVYDIQFTEPTAVEEDNALIEAVERAGGVVLATTEVDSQGRTNVFGGEEVLREIGARAANASFPSGDVIRRLPFQVDGLDSIAVAGAEAYLGRRLPRRSGSAWIDFAGKPGTLPAYSFSSVLDGRVPASAFRGMLVVVGPSAPTLKDVHPTSASRTELMSGAEVQANAIATVLNGLPLRSAPWQLVVAIVAVLSFLAPAASLRLRPHVVFPIAAAAGLAYAAAAQLAFERGLMLPVVIPLGALVAASVAALGIHYVVVAIERERVRDAFGRFVHEKVIGDVLERAGGDARLPGVRMEATVLFSDLRGSTTFSETLPAEEVIAIVNHYLREMSDAILRHGGTLVSYMGDGIMAVFGAPIEQPDHADRAVAAAREMLEERLPRFNEWLRERGHGQTLQMGIGLNSGVVMSGTVGHERRLEYAAIGDTTNTASRLESMTKDTPYSLFVADSTRALLNGGAEGLVLVGELPVRGKQAPIRVWSTA